jgi:hypothetical protein
MRWQRFNAFVIPCVLLGLMLISSGHAQNKFNFRRPDGLPSQQATAKQNTALTQPETSYTYTLFDFPGNLSSAPNGTVVSGKSKKLEIAGEYIGSGDEVSTGSYLMHYTVGKIATTESYRNIAVLGAAAGAFQAAHGVNKSGIIVGTYTDASGIQHGWELNGTAFSTITATSLGQFS